MEMNAPTVELRGINGSLKDCKPGDILTVKTLPGEGSSEAKEKIIIAEIQKTSRPKTVAAKKPTSSLDYLKSKQTGKIAAAYA